MHALLFLHTANFLLSSELGESEYHTELILGLTRIERMTKALQLRKAEPLLTSAAASHTVLFHFGCELDISTLEISFVVCPVDGGRGGGDSGGEDIGGAQAALFDPHEKD